MTFKERMCWKLAQLLPKRIQYYAFNLVFGYATTGKYGWTDCTTVTCATVSRRFAKDHNL